MLKVVHIDVTRAVLEALGWPGGKERVNRVACAAAFPDEVESIAVEHLGTHFLSWNFGAFTHFCRPVDPREGIFRGYSYHRDWSCPQFEPPGCKVSARPGAWGWLMDAEAMATEPLSQLLRTLDGHASVSLDDLTFPTAATMAGWVESLLGRAGSLSSARTEHAVDTLCGWALHFVQDCCVPHHVQGLLLGGHDRFEGEVAGIWRSRPELRDLSKLPRPSPHQVVSLRAACEQAATSALEQLSSADDDEAPKPPGLGATSAWVALVSCIKHTSIASSYLMERYAH